MNNLETYGNRFTLFGMKKQGWIMVMPTTTETQLKLL